MIFDRGPENNAPIDTFEKLSVSRTDFFNLRLDVIHEHYVSSEIIADLLKFIAVKSSRISRALFTLISWIYTYRLKD